VQEKIKQWCNFNHARLTVMEALEKLTNFIDHSDPDVSVANIVHAYQTAESIRNVYPNLDWLHLIGLIHDLGKLMASWGEPQSAVVGDTFPVGCAYSNKIVFGLESFSHNTDFRHSIYSKDMFGIYKSNCGLDNVTMSWGHDEYLYRVLKNHSECGLPANALKIIRYHSFYAWHTQGEYKYLCDKNDSDILSLVQEFNKFDLYSKDNDLPNIQALQPYYQGLCDLYIPGKLNW